MKGNEKKFLFVFLFGHLSHVIFFGVCLKLLLYEFFYLFVKYLVCFRSSLNLLKRGAVIERSY